MNRLFGPLTVIIGLGCLASFVVMAYSLFRSSGRTYSRSDARRVLTSTELFYRRRFWIAFAVWIVTGFVASFFSSLIER